MINKQKNPFDSIIGTGSGGNYAGGKTGHSELAERIYVLMKCADLSFFTAEQADHLERVLSGSIAKLWQNSLHKTEFKEKEWRPGRNQPGVTRNYGFYEWDHEHCWIDHPSIRISPEETVYYCSEPYYLENAGILGLAALIKDGWKICVEANHSTHFPGRTMLVRIRRPDKKP